MAKQNGQIQFLGQAGILMRGINATILIDPYLSDYVITGGYGSADLFSRNFPPPILPEDLPAIDAVFITHEHADHCDLDTIKVIAASYPKCTFIGPKPVRDHLESIANIRNRMVTPSPNTSTLAGILGIEYMSLPSAHYEIEPDAQSGEYEFLGYLIKFNDIVLYHSGDTVLYDGMIGNILNSNWKVDIACLPVNGRDLKREQLGIVGNLNADEAVQLATAIKAKVLIPMHNDLFSINQEDPALVIAAFNKIKEIKIMQMAPGEIINYIK
jgi:L-ascorbate 6-phosphate lactonase